MDSQDHKDIPNQGNGENQSSGSNNGLSREEMRAFLAGEGASAKPEGVPNDPFEQEAMEGFAANEIDPQAYDAMLEKLDARIESAVGAAGGGGDSATSTGKGEALADKPQPILRRLIPHSATQWMAAASIIVLLGAGIWLFNQFEDNGQVAFEKNFSPIEAEDANLDQKKDFKKEQANDPILEWAEGEEEDGFTPLGNVTITDDHTGPPEANLTEAEKSFYGVATEEHTFDIAEEVELEPETAGADAIADAAEVLAADDQIPASGYAGDLDYFSDEEVAVEEPTFRNDIVTADKALESTADIIYTDSQVIGKMESADFAVAPTTTTQSTGGVRFNSNAGVNSPGFLNGATVEGPTAMLNGQIYDAETGDPLIGASILVNGTMIGALTDYDGKFQLTVPVGYQELSVKSLGYDDQNQAFTFTDGEVQNRSFSLNQAALALEEVTIAAQDLRDVDRNYGKPSTDAMGYSESKSKRLEGHKQKAKDSKSLVEISERDMAIAFYEEEKFRKSVKYFERHLKVQPWDEQSLLLSANAYLVLDNAAEALAKLDALLAIPSSPYLEEANWYRALALLKLDRTTEAKSLLQQIADAGGTYAEKARTTLSDL